MRYKKCLMGGFVNHLPKTIYQSTMLHAHRVLYYRQRKTQSRIQEKRTPLSLSAPGAARWAGRYSLHLKQVLWYLCPPETRSSAAYTDRSHTGHLACSPILGMNGMAAAGGEDTVRRTAETWRLPVERTLSDAQLRHGGCRWRGHSQTHR